LPRHFSAPQPCATPFRSRLSRSLSLFTRTPEPLSAASPPLNSEAKPLRIPSRRALSEESCLVTDPPPAAIRDSMAREASCLAGSRCAKNITWPARQARQTPPGRHARQAPQAPPPPHFRPVSLRPAIRQLHHERPRGRQSHTQTTEQLSSPGKPCHAKDRTRQQDARTVEGAPRTPESSCCSAS
jgi:hypothetical protein